MKNRRSILAVLFVLNLSWFAAVASGQTAAGWKTEWERVLAAAKKEGRVVVLGPPGAGARKALADGFQKSFPGIEVEYSGATGPQQAARLLSERKAGQYLADAYVGSTTVTLETLRPAGALDPIGPGLILPDVIDAKKWLQGRLDFSDDDGKYNLVFSTNVKPPAAINPKITRKEEVNSYWDFLNPRWSGKIAMKDPTIPGPGSVGVIFWYSTPGLGKEFIRKFFTQQKLTLTRDDRLLIEWIARGEHLIGLAHSDVIATGLIAKGLPIEPMSAEQFKEGSYLTAGFGSVASMNRAPHPNAARVYINWLLSKEGQTEWSKESGYTSRRLDVPRDHLDPAVIPKEGLTYLPNYKEESVRLGPEVQSFLEGILKK